MTSLELETIKTEIRHITRPLWKRALIVVLLILATGAILRMVHDRQVEAKQHVSNTR